MEDRLVNIFKALEGVFDTCCQSTDKADFLNL